MGSFSVSLEKEDQLAQRMAGLGVRESDIDESFVRSGVVFPLPAKRGEGQGEGFDLISFKSGGINFCSSALFMILRRPVRRWTAFQISRRQPSRFFRH